MINAHFKSLQNQFLHIDTEKILTAPLYILLEALLPFPWLIILYFILLLELEFLKWNQ